MSSRMAGVDHKNLFIFAEDQRQASLCRPWCRNRIVEALGCGDGETSNMLRTVPSENPQPNTQALYGSPNSGE